MPLRANLEPRRRHPWRLALSLLTAFALVGCDGERGDAPAASSAAPTVTSSQAAPPDSEEALTKEARSLTTSFAGALEGALMKGMGKGPTEAVAVCNTEAPKIADSVEGTEGWTIGRTSLKLRNPKNAPDAWEREQLERFDEKKAAGASPETLEVSTIVERDGARELRFMKAIPTAAMCLTCHGSDVAEDVKAAIDRHYPEDAARGFAVGDLRGAFTLRKRL